MTDFDTDPAALAWARTKVQHEIDRAEKFIEQATQAGKPEAVQRWRFIANHLRNSFIGGDGCTIARFDERLPAFRKTVDGAIPPAIDRAVRRDHSLCGAEPCSECR
ncbi:hypothetical protein [Streptomyces sp. SAS_275]|uniref:hypothetical protein n=1 Tax=Streptomyces sp. SAS_275 TaxID=3412746 RepID=UPI00403CA7EE